MSHRELAGLLWSAVCASPQNWMNPWRPEDVAAKVQRAAEFVTRSDASAVKAHDAWLAAMGGDL